MEGQSGVRDSVDEGGERGPHAKAELETGRPKANQSPQIELTEDELNRIVQAALHTHMKTVVKLVFIIAKATYHMNSRGWERRS